MLTVIKFRRSKSEAILRTAWQRLNAKETRRVVLQCNHSKQLKPHFYQYSTSNTPGNASSLSTYWWLHALLTHFLHLTLEENSQGEPRSRNFSSPPRLCLLITPSEYIRVHMNEYIHVHMNICAYMQMHVSICTQEEKKHSRGALHFAFPQWEPLWTSSGTE